MRARIRAAYRVRACSAAVCAGAAVLALGTGAGMVLCLNAAYLAALAALPACAAAVLLAHRALTHPRRARIRHALLAALLLLLAVLALAALVSMAKQVLLPGAAVSYIARTGFLLAALCCVLGGTGVGRMAFALRYAMLLCIAALAAAAAGGGTAGLFPVLGPGARRTGLAACAMLAGAAPALLIALPPPELAQVDERTRLRDTPGAGFFLWRLLAGCAAAVVLLAVLTMSGTYEGIDARESWGGRMLLMGESGPRTNAAQTALVLLETAGLTLCAAQMLLGSAQALACALPRMRAPALPAVLALCAGLLTALVYAGLHAALAAGPLLSLPAAGVCLLCIRKGGSACGAS